MERNIHIDEFEDFLKEKADQYKMYPSEKAWKNISSSIHPGKKWPYISLTLLLLLGTAVFVDYNTSNIVSSSQKILSFKSPAIHGNQPSVDLATTTIYATIPPISTGLNDNVDNTSANSSFPDHAKKVIIAVNPPPEDTKEYNFTNNDQVDIPNPQNINSGLTISGNSKDRLNIATGQDENTEEKKKVLWGGEAFKKSKFEWQIFFSPTVSYRKLTSDNDEVTDVFRGVPYSTVRKASSVNSLVTHKPAIGAEVGANVVYKISNNFLLRAGLQLNYSRYQLRAYSTKPEEVTLAVVGNGLGKDSINVISTLQNFSGNGSSWYNNEYLQMSLPIGFEWGVLGNSVLKWNIAASAQPAYNFANNVYLLSTDFKRYGQDPSLIRKWNINAGVETYVSYNMGSFKWQAGPQLRYQLMSSYKSQYPVKEYLVDFGFKIGVTKTIR